MPSSGSSAFQAEKTRQRNEKERPHERSQERLGLEVVFMYFAHISLARTQITCFYLISGMPNIRGLAIKEGSGWGTHVYLWRIHFDIWQN